jgi:hypothetical protein
MTAVTSRWLSTPDGLVPSPSHFNPQPTHPPVFELAMERMPVVGQQHSPRQWIPALSDLC